MYLEILYVGYLEGAGNGNRGIPMFVGPFALELERDNFKAVWMCAYLHHGRNPNQLKFISHHELTLLQQQRVQNPRDFNFS